MKWPRAFSDGHPWASVVKSVLEMQLRAKRAMPRQEPLAQQRRRISDRSKKDAMLSSLLVQQGIDNTITEGYLRFPGKFRLLVKGDLWTAWSDRKSVV